MNVIDQAGESEIEYSAIYYHGDIGFSFSHTHKLAQDKPTITIQIPCDFFDKYWLNEKIRVHIADFLLREFKKYIDVLNAKLYNRARPKNESGWYCLPALGEEVLVRNAAFFALCPQRDYEYRGASTVYLISSDSPPLTKNCFCIRLQVQLPRRNIRKATQMLCNDLPKTVDKFVAELDIDQMNQVVELAEKQVAIRNWLRNSDYCAFIANGSVLPRAKGTNGPIADAVPFQAPPDDEIEVCGVWGMGIKKGITVITGGGYSGKSTVLDSISAGVYDHVLGDGRELCITDNTAVSIGTEDGRSVKCVNISPFFNSLPAGDAARYSTIHASGSVSQAANVMEAIEGGAKLLIIDEDRSAANFMACDYLMRKLIKKEPIVPFVDRVNELYNLEDVSTIVVVGVNSEWLFAADNIYTIDNYQIYNVTDQAVDICAINSIESDVPPISNWRQNRLLTADGFSSYPEGCGTERLEVSNTELIKIGDERIDISGLLDIVSYWQVVALGFMLRRLEISHTKGAIDVLKMIDDLYSEIEQGGLDIVYSSYFTTMDRFMELPRKQELGALINRMRKIDYTKA